MRTVQIKVYDYTDVFKLNELQRRILCTNLAFHKNFNLPLSSDVDATILSNFLQDNDIEYLANCTEYIKQDL